MGTYDEDTGYQSFVKISKDQATEDFMELPREKDGTILLSTVQAQFPSCIGLKYKSSSGGWRGIRAADNVLDPPFGGWGETIYYITEAEPLKRKASGEESSSAKSRKTSDLLQDIIVLGIPFTTTDEELEQYFTKTCGELAFHEVKYDRNTKKSRGFGFIRFKTEEAALEALNGDHEIGGRKLEVRESKKKETPMKLFVGRLPSGTTQDALKEYFSEFGDLDDVFVPAPFRGFGFVTFGSKDEGRAALRMSHLFEGVRLNVTIAEPKGEKPPRDQQQSYNPSPSNYTWKAGGDSNRNSSYGQDRFDSRNNQGGGGGGNDADLKNMLYAFLNNQK